MAELQPRVSTQTLQKLPWTEKTECFTGMEKGWFNAQLEL